MSVQGGISIACLQKWNQICRLSLLPLTIPTSDPICTTSHSFPSKSWQILLFFPQSGPWERGTWLDWIFHFYCWLYYPFEHPVLQLWHRHQQPHQKSWNFGNHPNCLRTLPEDRGTFLCCLAHWALISPPWKQVQYTLLLVQQLSLALQLRQLGWSIQLADLSHAVRPSCCLYSRGLKGVEEHLFRQHTEHKSHLKTSYTSSTWSGIWRYEWPQPRWTWRQSPGWHSASARLRKLRRCEF